MHMTPLTKRVRQLWVSLKLHEYYRFFAVSWMHMTPLTKRVRQLASKKAWRMAACRHSRAKRAGVWRLAAIARLKKV